MRSQISEKSFQAVIVRLGRLTGWKAHHQYDSRRSEPGWPDLVLIPIRPPARGTPAFIELKRHDGKLTGPQRETLKALRSAGLTRVWVWRPNQIDAIQTWLRAAYEDNELSFEQQTLVELTP